LRAVIFAALYPVLLLGAFPLGALVGETRPDLLWIPLAVALPSLPALAGRAAAASILRP
jgi:hypothetical protein